MARKTYLFIQRSAQSKAPAREAPSPAQMEEMYAKFNAWKEQFRENILDMGGKLAGGGKVVTSDDATDGPFVEAKEIVGGYMIVTADSLDEAVEVARQSPGVAMPGSSVEVREIALS
ncbi:YciI family protein [Pelagibius sp. CAU 1746]|uniref:YciI family protein n=1 Tax=Pelagibius sp. CAU 1746 TaxID=3140370 RepID=UPI00325C1C14